MLLALDVDGTVAQTHQAALDRLISDGYLPGDPNLACWRSWRLSESFPGFDERHLDSLFADPTFYADLEPFPGVAAWTQRLRASKHEVHIVTSRPWGLRRVTGDWLSKHGIPYRVLMVNVQQKNLYTRAVHADCLIDDDPNANPTHLIDAPYNASMDLSPAVRRVSHAQLYSLI